MRSRPNRTEPTGGSHNVHPIKLSPSPWSYVTTRRGRRTVAERYVSLVTVTARDEHLNVGLAPSLLASPLPGNEKRHTVQRIHTTTEVYCRSLSGACIFHTRSPGTILCILRAKKEEKRMLRGIRQISHPFSSSSYASNPGGIMSAGRKACVFLGALKSNGPRGRRRRKRRAAVCTLA